MHLKLRCVVLLVFGMASTVFGQDLKLALNIRAEDGQYSKLILVAPVFGFRTDSVSNPLDISASVPETEVYWRKAILPKMNRNFRSGFAWVYDGSSNLDFAKSYTLLAIENPSWTAFPTVIWADRNHNFDFTDDGKPDTITLTTGMTLSLGSNTNGYQVFLEHFPSRKYQAFESMNDQAISKLKGNRNYLGTAASLREKRLNVLAANWSNGHDSFCLGVKDVNCNGIYNEAGVDVVMITRYNGVFDNLQGVVLGDKSKAYLEWNNAAYSILNVDASGNFIEVKRDTSGRLRNSLNIGDKIPKFKYCSATKPAKHKSIRRLKGKYIYVYVWRDGEEIFFRDSAAWHDLGRLQLPDFEVLGLNYGASANYVYRYNNYYETRIRHGYSSNDINRTLLIKQIPTGILLDKKQRIVAVGLTPAQAKQWVLNK